ncbi:hypothetical protein [Acaryochloris thomasi]|nr:hypothetical protein [Acaryochloris thomasi]
MTDSQAQAQTQTMNNTVPTTDNWTQFRTEGSTRLNRIGTIFKTAFVETKTELQSGTEVMKPLAQELSSTVVDNLKDTGTKINDAWTDKPGSPDLPTTLRSLLLSFAGTVKARLFPWLKSEAATIDATLTKNYGDRYGAAKHKVKVAKAWYAQATAPVEVPMEPSVTVEVVATEAESSQSVAH